MTAPHAAIAFSRLRTLVEWCVYLLLVAGLVHMWLIEGVAIPCQVVGDSMAETLLGMHRDVVCGDCRRPFRCGNDVPAAVRAVCPNCGYAANDLVSLPDVDGDRVLIARAAYSMRAPRRWEIAAFRGPTLANELVVKRVVGLPGELIEIRHGDVYVDGHIQRKNLPQQQALAILVHDARFQPTREPTPPPRWRAERPKSRWTAADGCFAHTAGPEGEPIDWLVYHHWRRLAGSGGGVRPSPVTDLCGYNPSRPRREEDVHAVADLLLRLQLECVSGSGLFLVRATDGGDEFEVRLQCDAKQQHYEVSRNGRPIPGAVGEIPRVAGPQVVEASLVDQQFLLALDGEVVAAYPYDRPEPPPTPQSCPLAIGEAGFGRDGSAIYGCTVTSITPTPSGRRRTAEAAGLYVWRRIGTYVLGDNSPVSEDSRTLLERGVVDAKLLVGKPLAAIPTIPVAFCGQWYFQVPNPAESEARGNSVPTRRSQIRWRSRNRKAIPSAFCGGLAPAPPIYHHTEKPQSSCQNRTSTTQPPPSSAPRKHP